ncbi:hypothetical protein RDABS01_009165 [Bienertia sinuspersici]
MAPISIVYASCMALLKLKTEKKLRNRGSDYLPRAKKFTEWRIRNGLIELPSQGPAFTWCNNRGGGELIYQQLDRAYCNEDWRSLFPDTVVINHENKKDEIIKQTWSKTIEGSSMFRNMRKQEAVAKACRSWCLECKKKLGITLDLFIEELGPLQAATKVKQYGDLEVFKRQDCREKANHSIYTRNRGKKSLEADWDTNRRAEDGFMKRRKYQSVFTDTLRAYSPPTGRTE